MRNQESYWSFEAPPTPEYRDLPETAFAGTEDGWNSLSPGFRREIFRSRIIDEARARAMPDETIERLKIALIDGSATSLDEYLWAFEAQDAARAPLPEDAQRLSRADAKQHQSEVQIAAREAV